MKQKYIGLFYFTLGVMVAGASAYADPDPHNVLVSKSYLTSVMPAAQVQTDWNATTGMGAILNKPSLATVATSGSYTDLTNTPTIPTLPTGTSGNIVTYDTNGAIGGSLETYAGATTQNPYNATNDAGKVATMGAVMTAITNNPPATLTVGADETAAIGAYSTTFAASGTNVWPAGDASLFVDGTALATGLSLKQNKIPATGLPTVVVATSTAGVVDQYDISTNIGGKAESGSFTMPWPAMMLPNGTITDIGHRTIPTAKAVTTALDAKQNEVAPSGYEYWYDSTNNTPYNTNAASDTSSWLNAGVKGTGLVTKTSANGVVGERKIFEASDVSGYHAGTLTQNEKDIQDISIPTVGAMMSVLANGTSKISWGATETTAVQNYSTVFDGTTNNWPAADAGKLVDGTGLATALAEKQNKIPAYASGGSKSLLTDGATDGTVDKVAIATAMGTSNATNNAKIPTVGLLRDQLVTKQLNLNLSSITTQSGMETELPRMSLNNVALDRDALYLVPAAAAAQDEQAVKWMNDGRGIVLTQDAVTVAMGKLYDDVKIPATRSDSYSGGGRDTVPSLVGTTDTAGTIGQHLLASDWIAPLTSANNAPAVREFIDGNYTASNFATASGLSSANDVNWAIPSLQLLSGIYGDLGSRVTAKQNTIPKAGYAATGGALSNAYNTNGASDRQSWLSSGVMGSSLVSRTSTDGAIGERKIFEATDVSGYGVLTGNNKLIADISIPTVGAMMSVLANGTSKISWGATETTAVQNYSTTFDGTSNNWPAADSGKLVDGTGLATALAEKQNKISGYNSSTESQSILADSTTDGTVAKRAIFDGSTVYVAGTHATHIPTMGAVMAEVEDLQRDIDKKQDKATCVQWSTGTPAVCYAYQFTDVSCKSYGASYTNVNECCSGVSYNNTCGCSGNSDCPSNQDCNTSTHQCAAAGGGGGSKK